MSLFSNQLNLPKCSTKPTPPSQSNPNSCPCNSSNKSQYANITQYYKLAQTTNQNPPYGIASFYNLGPQSYSICPTTCHGFHPNQYNTYQQELCKHYGEKKNCMFETCNCNK